MKAVFFCKDEARAEQLVLALRLRWPDLKPYVASEASLGLQTIEQEGPDLVILCEHLADMSIWESIREIRRFSDLPIIVATEGGDEMEVVKAFELGADDYIKMPCNLMVVMARVVALLRRVGIGNQHENESPIRCGSLLLNPATYEAFMGENRLVLTPTEFRLLHLLAKNRHITLTQEFIQRAIWADEIESGSTLKKYVQRLRKKLGDDARNPIWIRTVHGIGYRFSASETEPSQIPASI